MSKGHNKKRNVGIVYEQLVATVSKAMVENDRSSADKALKIIKKYFAPGTELYREFRLFNALVQTHVSTDALASRILQETKDAAHKYDVNKLRSEKSDLINEINRSFNKDTFYSTPVKNYKTLATIHVLMEEWRNDDPDVSRRVMYESNLHNWLLTPKIDETLESQKTPSVNNLSVKIMRETFNKKYDKLLNEKQKMLLKSLILDSSGAAASVETVSKRMSEQREKAKGLLINYGSVCESAHVKKKIPDVVRILEGLDTGDTSDKNVARMMTVIQLCDEILENRDEQ